MEAQKHTALEYLLPRRGSFKKKCLAAIRFCSLHKWVLIPPINSHLIGTETQKLNWLPIKWESCSWENFTSEFFLSCLSLYKFLFWTFPKHSCTNHQKLIKNEKVKQKSCYTDLLMLHETFLLRGVIIIKRVRVKWEKKTYHLDSLFTSNICMESNFFQVNVDWSVFFYLISYSL